MNLPAGIRFIQVGNLSDNGFFCLYSRFPALTKISSGMYCVYLSEVSRCPLHDQIPRVLEYFWNITKPMIGSTIGQLDPNGVLL